MYGGLEAGEVALGLHPDNTAAVRTAKSTKPQPGCKSIETGEHIPMPPDSDGIAPGAGVGPDPFKMAALFINVLEFNANGKYHEVLFLWSR